MKDIYNHKEIEARWQGEWDRRKSFAAKENNTQPRYYGLEMFPYPSGHLHMGHVRNYSLGDVVARYQRMKGKNVLHPIGWDAFGLPAENAAIKNKVHPEQWTRQNIAHMRTQLKSLGISYDWDREFATCDPAYYRWNQWFFIEFFKKGLVYKKKAAVNWCPSCKTVLANEQVSAAGLCWRCDSKVEAKELEQWFFKITAFADQLLKDHQVLKGKWPDEVLAMQAHWIGKSDGAEVVFKVKDRADSLTVFTTRPDTLFGATFLAIAPDHPLALALAKENGKTSELQAISAVQRERKRDRQESQNKEGFFLGAYALNPLNGQAVPIWTADYVLMDYGTGAIMAVPAHDQRDFDFATKYKIPVIAIVYNNNCWGTFGLAATTPRATQVHLFQEAIRYDRIAEAYGARGEYVNTPEAYRAALQRAYDAAVRDGTSTLINCQGHRLFSVGRLYPPGGVGSAEPGVAGHHH